MSQLTTDQPQSLSYTYPTSVHTSLLEELRDDNIKDLDTALRKIQEERKRWDVILKLLFRYLNSKIYFNTSFYFLGQKN